MVARHSLLGLGLAALVAGCVAPAQGGEGDVGSVESALVAPGAPSVSAPQKLVAADGLTGDWFGGAVAISGARALVTAPYATIDGLRYQGSTFVYVRSGEHWVEEAKLVVPDGNADAAGWAVALDGDVAVIGAPLALSAGQSRGAVFVFERSCGRWTKTATITAADGASGDNFGESVGVSGDTIVVGAPYATIAGSAGQGAAYVYRARGGSGAWKQEGKLVASAGTAGQGLGYFVAIDGDLAVAGAPFVGSGAAYAFGRTGATWKQEVAVSPGDTGPDTFGASVWIRDHRFYVGAPGDSTGGIAGRGAVYVYDGSKHWSLAQKLLAADAQANDAYGMSVVAGDRWVVVGAWMATVNGNEAQGAAYAYAADGSAKLAAPTKLTARDGAAGDQFGLAVGTWGDEIISGAYAAQVGENEQQGAAYAFEMRKP